MPNRIYDNVIAVDSAMGNFSIIGGASSNITQYRLTGISFTAINTLGRCLITAVNTLDIIADFSIINAGSGIINGLQSVSFAAPLLMGDIKCPTLSAGSARVYLA